MPTVSDFIWQRLQDWDVRRVYGYPGDGAKMAPESDVPPRVGMEVFSVDGHKIGNVESIDATPDGRVTAVNVTTGGFLGFGTKLVAIPEGRFAMVGNVVRVDMTAEDVSALPHHGP